MTDETKIEECDACGFAPVEVESYDRPDPGRVLDPDQRTIHLCKICANTVSGNVLLYPRNERSAGEVIQMVAYIGNAILAEIRAHRAAWEDWCEGPHA